MKYYYDGNITYAVGSYAGKIVKAKAVCAEEDEYNRGAGELLAKLRCELKIAKKRLNKADRNVKQARSIMLEASDWLNKELKYRENAKLKYYEAVTALNFFEEQMKQEDTDHD